MRGKYKLGGRREEGGWWVWCAWTMEGEELRRQEGERRYKGGRMH